MWRIMTGCDLLVRTEQSAALTVVLGWGVTQASPGDERKLPLPPTCCCVPCMKHTLCVAPCTDCLLGRDVLFKMLPGLQQATVTLQAEVVMSVAASLAD